jgi:hypothetical protein
MPGIRHMQVEKVPGVDFWSGPIKEGGRPPIGSSDAKPSEGAPWIL